MESMRTLPQRSRRPPGQKRGQKSNAGQNIEVQQSREILMEPISAKKQVASLFEGLPLSPVGLARSNKARARNLPCPVLVSLSLFKRCVKSVVMTLDSMLQDAGLDPVARAFVQRLLTKNITVLQTKEPSSIGRAQAPHRLALFSQLELISQYF